jgi:uncharacterized protein (DUF362 family)
MINLLESDAVAVYRDKDVISYCKEPPFNPSVDYPEYPFQGRLSQQSNKVYEAVRNSFILLGLDKENINTPLWNPLGDIIKPGQKVVIKPNFVLDRHYENGNIEAVITQPDVIRAICDYAYIALGGKGELVIADAPQANCDFDNLLHITRIKTIGEFYKNAVNFDLPVYDLRQLKLRNFVNSSSRIIEDGDPLGYALVDLGSDSSFTDVANIERIYGADYDRKETMIHHNYNKHEYCISKTILSADVVISIPKMKVHRKAGVTLNLKNIVGINGNKNYLPHYRIGLPEDGGDEFPELTGVQKKVMYTDRKLLDILLAKPTNLKVNLYKFIFFCYKVLKKFFPMMSTEKIILGGDWSGNDTIWRTILDLNKILLYADKEGKLQETPQRGFLCVIDGIIAGENEGPLIPTEKPCGIIACGTNPLVADIAVARIMGFDIKNIPKLTHALSLERYVFTKVKPSEIEIKSNIVEYCDAFKDNDNRVFLGLKPARGWIGAMGYGVNLWSYGE